MDSDADDPIVWVSRQWNDWMMAAYHFPDIEHSHRARIGGARALPFIRGYVLRDGVTEGRRDHACLHGPPPHRVKVCGVKKGKTLEAG